MKVSELRKIIREEVKSAIKEELSEVLKEAVSIASTPVTETESKPFKNLKPTFSAKKPEPKFKTGNSTLDEMLRQTATTATGEELKQVMGANGPSVASTVGHQMMRESQGPQPGLDISKLDFVNKAKAVLDAAYQKDQSKVGV